MSGVKVVRYLLASDTDLLAQVPVTRIISGKIPQGTLLPAVGLGFAGGDWRTETDNNDTTKYSTCRIQVTVQAANYPQLEMLMPLVRAAVPRVYGSVNGVNVAAVMLDVEGPDMSNDDAGFYVRTQDFIVSFNE